MSQDILFHYFYNLSQGGAFTPTTKDLTPLMLRTLISNPCLARKVRMMALFIQCNTSTLGHGITRQDLQSWVEVSRSLNVLVMEEITTALEGEGGETNAVLYFDEPGPAARLQIPSQEDDDETDWETDGETDGDDEGTDGDNDETGWEIDGETDGDDEETDGDDDDDDDDDELPNSFRHVFYEWLYCLLLKLAPNVTHVQLNEPMELFGEPSESEVPARVPSFPHVRVLTYNTFYADHKEVVKGWTQFPNVSTFGCYDSTMEVGLSIDPMHSGHPLTNIRKLSIACWPEALSDLLKCCPQLQDLEVHINYDSMLETREFKWPSHTKANLRRLAYSDDESSEFLVNANDPRTVLPPFTDFDRLEILEIDQASLLLYSRSKTGETSRYVLPQSLRILHIAFAQDVSSVGEISDSLLELTAAKANVLPNLSIVKVDYPPSPTVATRNLAETMYAAGSVTSMENAGIELRFELEESRKLRKGRSWPDNPRSRRGYNDVRRIVPLLVGSSLLDEHIQEEPQEQQCELFSLDDLESL